MDTDYYKEKIIEMFTDETYYKEESRHPEKTTLHNIRTLINEYQDSFTDK